MFDGGDVLAGGIAEHRAQVSGADFGGERTEFARRLVTVGQLENDAGVGVGGKKVDGDRGAAMDADTGQCRARFQGCLVVLQTDPHVPFLARPVGFSGSAFDHSVGGAHPQKYPPPFSASGR